MKRKRLLAGGIFGFAGFIAAFAVDALFFGSALRPSGIVGYLVLPTIAAGASGSWLGGRILEEKPGFRGAFRAMGRALTVTLLAYPIFWALFVVVFAVFGASGGGATNSSSILAVIYVGTFWTLLPALVMGAAAGGLLYSLRPRTDL